MKTLLRLIVWGLIVLLPVSCSRSGVIVEDDPGGGPHVFNPTDTSAPDITINTPAPNQVFVSGSTINITGKITDDYGLYRGTIKVINDANGFEMKNQAYEIHGFRTYDFSLSHLTAVTVPSDYTVVVSFEDHGLNITTKSVKIKVNP